MFSRARVRDLENLVSMLRTEIADLRSAIRSERESFASERQSLIEQVLAVQNPGALREIRNQKPLGVRATGPGPRRFHFPGAGGALKRPDPPATPFGPTDDVDMPDVEMETPDVDGAAG